MVAGKHACSRSHPRLDADSYCAQSLQCAVPRQKDVLMPLTWSGQGHGSHP